MTALPTEIITRYVVRDRAGRTTAVTNELGATQLGGAPQTLTVPTEDAVRAVLTGLEDVGGVSRCGDILTWTVTPTGGRKAYVVIDAIRHATGWPVSPSPSGGCAFVWPTPNVNAR